MKKSYGAANPQQFYLTFTQRRPNSCVERISHAKKCNVIPVLKRCKSQHEVSQSSASTNNQLSNHECLALDHNKLILDGIKSQQILISSALRRPHASCYSLLDSQSLPEPAKPRRAAGYRPKSASTVYSYAERPVSACEISNHLGRQTKTSVLRNKSPAHEVRNLDDHASSRKIRKKKLCVLRDEYVLHKNLLTPKEVFDYMKSAHAYLTGARYNRSRLVDAKSVTKHGLYVSKDGLGSFIVDKVKAVSSDKEHDVCNAAMKVVESKISQAGVLTVGTNTVLSQELTPCYVRKHLPPRTDDKRKPLSSNKVKPIKTQYIDYNFIVR